MPRKRKKRRLTRQKKGFFSLAGLILAGLILLYGLNSIPLSVPFSSYSSAVFQNEKQYFIEQIRPVADSMQQKYGVPASVSMAQAILESDWGQSELAADYHNLFGVKGDDPANTVRLLTQEYRNGEWQTVEADFRVYQSWEESIEEHAILLTEGTSWNPRQYSAVLQAADYRQAAYALYDAGYATDPDYPVKLIEIIEDYGLAQYDLAEE